jgi:lysyl-tRNA synthetase class 1
MPICEECGRISTTRVVDVDPGAGEVSYVCDRDFKARQGKQRIPVPGCGHEGAVTVFGGNVKVGWKVDWALRWYVFGVDYEMYGKDLIDSAEISSQIVETLVGTPPIGLVYEWFNDENGQAISKTKGNGLTIEEWLRYGPLESMNWYIYQNPSKAKKLYFGVIPRSVDSYLEDRSDFGEQDDEAERLDNPIWFVERRKIDEGASLDFTSDVSYTMLLNLVSVLNTADRDIVWEYLLRYDDSVEEDREFVDRMIDCAMRYYEDFVLPTKSYEVPPAEMMPAVDQFRQFLRDYEGDSAEELQTAAYTAGKDHDLSLGKWFRAMYRLLLGQDRGPRLGTFVHLYGVDETLALIDEKLAEG